MEELDVCIVGAGVAGLTAALGLRRADPRLSIKVLDSRPMPTSKYGGFITLQPNGRKAAAAISPDLAAALEHNALHEKRTLLHGEDGRLITRLDMPHELAPSEDIVQSNEQDPRKRGQTAANRDLNACTHETLIIGWWELERLLLSMLPDHTVEYEASFLKYSETDAGVVAIFEGLAYPIRCKALLGCDGPFSGVRAQCVQDSEPAYDRTVKYNGRLDGMGEPMNGIEFCHVSLSEVPKANGDVGWEALVSEREIQAAGFTYDESLARVLPADYERGAKDSGGADIKPSETLAALFKGYPKAVDQMIRYTSPEAILESGVYIRSPAEMPPSMGKGRVVILGEAAHPLRPTGQDSNLAFEDAAEFAAFVQDYGLCKEALRRYDVARRPRWRFAMQLTMAQGASTTTGVAISRGFLDYTQDLYLREFCPIGKVKPPDQGLPGVIKNLLRLSFAAGLLVVLATAGSGLFPEALEAGKEGEQNLLQKMKQAGAMEKKRGVLKKGMQRMRRTFKTLQQRITQAWPIKSINDHYIAAKHFAERRAEGITDTTIDYGGLYAKRAMNRRIARFFGVF